ncbi:conserved protein of unknown function [Candidatus Filomicrobium marinum]|uniref:Uncharacterized protein n=1 Tax=Candidatus Filomicrobium marinum TaxID=1608628 RepID=A0A0D6JJ79_9HYPH|nr:hypothetical protein [Candidatus Filomicrobium marinum]CFX36120.1 conserved protein of unknown function [Candidatus Filomicrobium marinum]CPR21767.1 conserved protein of unknown function [Candidatus Filomicrobium marinum]
MVDAVNPAQQLADEEFAPNLRPLVPPALKRAYATVEHVIDEQPWLATPSARYGRGDLVRLASEYEFYKLIQTGALPFEPSWEPYSRPTGKHLVMRTKRALITINQVESPSTMPRKAVFRNTFGLPNTSFLFEDWNREIEERADRKHLLLVHGYQELTFSNLAMPNVETKQIAWKSANLLDLPHQVTEPAKDEGPTDSPDPEAIENIIRMINDNDLGNE